MNTIPQPKPQPEDNRRPPSDKGCSILFAWLASVLFCIAILDMRTRAAFISTILIYTLILYILSIPMKLPPPQKKKEIRL